MEWLSDFFTVLQDKLVSKIKSTGVQSGGSMTTAQYFILDMLWHCEVYQHKKLRGGTWFQFEVSKQKTYEVPGSAADLEIEFCVGQLISQPAFHFLSMEKWSTHQCIVEGLVS